MTDLGVFACAAWAAANGENIYAIRDWHGWHYQYPPALAILFRPLAHPLPTEKPNLAPGTPRTAVNTPWGYGIDNHSRFFGLHRENVRFFFIVAIWYAVSVLLAVLSAHALACGLEGSTLRDGPPIDLEPRRRWWALRLVPLLVCAGSIGTDFSRGQVDVLMLATIALALYLATIGWRFSAGVLFSIPAAIKLFPPLLLLYPFWRRQWRMSLGLISGLLFLLALLPAAAFGPKRTGELYRTWIHVLAQPAVGLGTDTSRRGELTGMNATDNQSLLVFIHNWQYHDRPRKQRPAEAAAAARAATYAAGALMLLGVAIASGWRKQDSPRRLFLIAGLLIGVALVVNPIVHNYYYLLLLPLVAALLNDRLLQFGSHAGFKALPLTVWSFMIVDVLARLPNIGGKVRDWGFPLASLAWLLAAGAMALWKQEPVAQSGVASEAHTEAEPEVAEIHHSRAAAE